MCTPVHTTPELNGSEAISERFQLRTVKDDCVLGTVLSLDPFLDHYLLLRVNGESVLGTVPIKNG